MTELREGIDMVGVMSDAFRFDGPVRRRGRLLGRLGAVAITPSMYPTAPLARAFWFDGIANFGDALTPWLLRRAGVIPVPATASTAEVVGVGSILELLPQEYAGYVWGSGSLRGDPIDLPHAQFRAVRGSLTRDLVGAGDVALGDPGILVSRFMRRPRPRWQIGIVPHHLHEDDPLWARMAVRAPGRVKVIDVRRGPSKVLAEIASCESVISTSLHGLITADAFGIPAVWARREPDLWGGQFKFDDYETAVSDGSTRRLDLMDDDNPAIALRRARTVDATRLRDRQDGLLQALRDLPLRGVVPAAAIVSVMHRSASHVP